MAVIPADQQQPGELLGSLWVVMQAWPVADRWTVALLGPDGGQITDGYGDWNTIAVPRDVPISEWTGRRLYAMDLDMRCSCPDWEVPCKHLAAACYVLAEEFDRDPFAMLAWRGKGRDEVLAALRRIQASGPHAADPGRAARAGSLPGTGDRAAALNVDVPAPPLAECLEAFWSPGLSPARLRALASAPGPAAPDLLLRMFPPPPARVRGKALAELLAPAYHRLADPGSGSGL
jgi:hypothetical protein